MRQESGHRVLEGGTESVEGLACMVGSLYMLLEIESLKIRWRCSILDPGWQQLSTVTSPLCSESLQPLLTLLFAPSCHICIGHHLIQQTPRLSTSFSSLRFNFHRSLEISSTMAFDLGELCPGGVWDTCKTQWYPSASCSPSRSTQESRDSKPSSWSKPLS